ncbi:hypothetical protein BV25DRAFT_1917962 [Artomyces pyxidatus]|uniref:Uncharacterized protein n=1 Tax=Artomyces pyxidatus TaxID=48021 RepID=A0ACB8SV87_9AGAM|nr:hypothetical protein BV25DRAFT_1917962 [Artomyces pyxidatus]
MSQNATYHNRVASRLSPEILEMVFRFTAAAWPTSKRGVEGRRYDLGWIQVTHVCRYWREVALRDYRLWMEISLNEVSAPWRSEMLVRSRNRPLALSVDFRRSEPDLYDDLLCAVIKESTLLCTKHLSVTLPFDQHSALEVLVNVFVYTGTAPLLESLDITNGLQSYSYPIPPHLLQTGMPPDAPNLKSLRLVNCCINWSMPRFKTLTHLDIEVTVPSKYPRWDVKHGTTSYHLVTGLRSLPALESLRLRGIFRKSTTEAIGPQLDPNEVTRLPNLTELWLHGPTQICVEVALHLEYPSTTRVQIRTTKGPATHDLPQLLSRLPALCTLKLDLRYWADMHMTLWDAHHDRKSAHTATPIFDLNIGRSPDRKSQANYVTGNPLLGLKLQNITSLIFETSRTLPEFWPEERWRMLFAPAVNVRALHLIDKPALAGALLGLCSPVEGKHASFCGPEFMMLFPSLEKLAFSGLTMHDMLIDDLPIWDLLFWCLELRRTRGCDIKLVELPGPRYVYPPETPWNRLQGLVTARIGEFVG